MYFGGKFTVLYNVDDKNILRNDIKMLFVINLNVVILYMASTVLLFKN